MAKEQPQLVDEFDPAAELRDYAAELFARRTANGVRGTLVEKVATDCFKDARIFLQVAAKVASGEISSEPAPANPLSEVSAPNLKATHPHNMVSQRFGSLERVARVYEQLSANPALQELPELDWREAEVSLARLIFPECLKRAGRVPASIHN